jgi:hypothetical protein
MLRNLLVTALLALPLAAAAQSYRCVGKDGKKYYGQTVPPPCLGMPVEQLNAQGMVVRKFDAQATAADRDKKEAEEVERKKREAISKEEGRRARALLATYTSEADIDQARVRALKDNEAAVKDIERRVAAMKQKDKELKALQAERAAKKEAPRGIDQDITNNAFDIKTQEELLATKQKEVDVINARYDDDKKRYRELTKSGTK